MENPAGGRTVSVVAQNGENAGRRGCVIFNPKAGSADDAVAFETGVRQRGDITFCQTQAAGHGIELATEAAHRGDAYVIAAGGDGSISEIVSGLMHAREAGLTQLPALVVAPLGTGNDFARTLDLPWDAAGVIERLDLLQPAPLDVMRWRLTTPEGEEQSGYAVNTLAGGFSSKLQASLTTDLKKTWGPLAYVRAAAGEVANLDAYELSMSIDGGRAQTVLALNVVVANARFAGGGIEVAPPADPSDGRLNLVVITPGDLVDIAELAAALVSGSVTEDDHVIHVPGSRFVLESNPPMPFNVDGDRVGTGRLEAEVIPGALTVMRPA